MHIDMPETVYWDSQSVFIHQAPDEPEEWYHYWLCPPEDRKYSDDESGSLFFRERRRKTYSDVCHSKVVGTRNSEVLEYTTTGAWKVKENHYIGSNLTVESPGSESPGRQFAGCNILCNGEYALILTCKIVDEDHYVNRYISTNWKALRFNKKNWSRASAFYQETRLDFRVNTNTEQWRVRRNGDNFQFESLVQPFVQLIDLDRLRDRDLKYSREFGLYLLDVMGDLFKHWFAENRYFTGNITNLSSVHPTRVNSETTQFLFNEPYVIMDHVDDMLLGRGTEHYFRNVAIQNAYLDAIMNVPRMSDNHISTILEIIGFIKSLVIDKRVELPKSISDGWLAYRYQYSTTKMDVEEAISYVNRRIHLKDDSPIKCYGQHTLEYEGSTVQSRCEFLVQNKVLSTVKKIWLALTQYGLAPSFYVVWDMIPFSFIADWFLPIQSIVNAWDAQHRVEEFYEIKDINFSLSYDRVGTISVDKTHFYTRWLSETPIPLCGWYFMEGDEVSDKTFGYRILDAASLILG